MNSLTHSPLDLETVLTHLHTVPILASLQGPEDQEHLRFIATSGRQRHFETGEQIARKGDAGHTFYILLEGSVALSYESSPGTESTAWTYTQGDTFGELPLLANMPLTINLTVVLPADVLELDEEQFWTLMNRCPGVRKAILKNMAMRLTKTQQATFQQEKMASLGTLAAGLMHELNNPGAAARRASVQLRERLQRMHTLSAQWTKAPFTQDQKQCMYELQDFALTAKPKVMLDSLTQADAEDTLAAWMEKAGIEDAWKIAPTLVSVGIDADVLDCAHHSLPGPWFSMALNWLEALVGSMQLVGTIEESIGRVTDLVHAVKTYAYESRGQQQTIDVNNSIYATLIILAHKMREKEIVLEKQLDAKLPPLHTGCQGINQVWTNLLDNAIDAVPQGGRIRIKTWSEPSATRPTQTDLCILIADNGEGIPASCQSQIFDPFFTTKPVGVGTGLGLGIVYRVVEGCGGVVRFTSTPGDTEFMVRLPSNL